MGVEIVKVKDVDDGIRLNRWFIKYYPNITLGRLQKLLRTKQVKVDGKKVEASHRMATGEEVRIPPLKEGEMLTEKSRELSPRDIEFIRNLVIFMDENIIAINKPSGLAVQGGTNTYYHVDWMLDGLCFENEERPKLVHRIDKDTSGVLLLARNRKTAELLTKSFRDHSMPKTYLAFVNGCPKKKSGEINASIEKMGEKSIVSDDGQFAKTEYEVIDVVGDRFALVEASPLTGRTHQIRVHMEALGCPIVGDDKYFGEERQRVSLFADKLHLHAYKIDLSYIYNKKLLIKAELPTYFVESLKAAGIDFRG